MSHSLNNSTKQRFISRTSEFSTRGSRTGANLLGWESDENLTDEQLRDCLVARSKQVVELIRLLPKNSGKRKALGLVQLELQNKINELRPKRIQPDIKQYFVDVCREEMSAFEFNRIMTLAVNLKEKSR